jgi:hypothetical protein
MQETASESDAGIRRLMKSCSRGRHGIGLHSSLVQPWRPAAGNFDRSIAASVLTTLNILLHPFVNIIVPIHRFDQVDMVSVETHCDVGAGRCAFLWYDDRTREGESFPQRCRQLFIPGIKLDVRASQHSSLLQILLSGVRQQLEKVIHLLRTQYTNLFIAADGSKIRQRGTLKWGP